MVITLYRSPFTPGTTTSSVRVYWKLKFHVVLFSLSSLLAFVPSMERGEREAKKGLRKKTQLGGVCIHKGMRECALSRLKNQNTEQTNQKWKFKYSVIRWEKGLSRATIVWTVFVVLLLEMAAFESVLTSLNNFTQHSSCPYENILKYVFKQNVKSNFMVRAQWGTLTCVFYNLKAEVTKNPKHFLLAGQHFTAKEKNPL